jgi:hypothetical protein
MDPAGPAHPRRDDGWSLTLLSSGYGIETLFPGGTIAVSFAVEGLGRPVFFQAGLAFALGAGAR